MSKKILSLFTSIFLFLIFSASPVSAVTVGLYDIFEQSVTNTKSYSNKFDYRVIELRTSFISPSGKTWNFFGFYDGNGSGGQTGSVWKFRFMPNEIGRWTYSYSWSDGTSGGSGNFDVTDTVPNTTRKLPGPLKIATDNPWYFDDSRGNKFDFRGYDMHITSRYAPSFSYISEQTWLRNQIATHVINQGYNFTMWDSLNTRNGPTSVNNWNENWWVNKDKYVFNIAAFRAYENTLNYLKDNRIYMIPFDALFSQGHHYPFTEMKPYLHYYVGRFAAYYNFFGWTPTWEWMDIWTAAQVDEIMTYVYNIDPWKRLLSAHDCSNNAFTPWLKFSMRQANIDTLLEGNSRTIGKNQPGCNSPGGVGSNFANLPIIGSEDIWEMAGSENPNNATEIRRAAWGEMLAGVIPFYSDWTPNPPPTGGNGAGEPEVRRMFDFFYSKTKYRQYIQMNSKVTSSSGEVAMSGVANTEYLAYDTDGGSMTIDLAGVSTSTNFDVLWYDPKNGSTKTASSVAGGAKRTLTSPFSGDSVVLLTKATGATNTPSPTATKTPTPSPTKTPTPTLASKPGDANGDGLVDGADYTIWRSHYNITTTGGVSHGDFNLSGKVEGVDYTIWLANYGK